MHTTPVSWRRLFYQSNYFPLVLLLFLGGFYVIPASKWHNNIYYTSLLLPFLAVFPWRNIGSRFTAPVMATAFLLVLYLVISLLWSPVEEAGDYRKAVSGLYVGIFLLLGCDALLRYPDYYDRLFYWLGRLILLTGPLSIWLFYREHPFPGARLNALGRLDHPGWAAMMYGFIGLYHLIGILQTGSRNRRQWVQGGLVSLVALAVMLLGQSRGALAALLITLVTGALLTRQWRYWLLPALLTAGLLVLAWWWKLDLWAVLNRDGWDSYRLEIWRQAIDLIRQAPVLGYGILENHTFPIPSGKTAPHAHNILLATCLSGGFIAGALLLVLTGLVLRQGWRYMKRTSDIRPLLVTLFGLIYMLTDGYKLISSPWPNWLYFWLPVAWAASQELKARSGINNQYKYG